MKGRECDKCVYHTTGQCSKWDCEPTSIEDIKNKTIDDFLMACGLHCQIVSGQKFIPMSEVIRIADKLKSSNKVE